MTQKSHLRFFISYFLLPTFYFLLSSGCIGKRINFEPKSGDPIYEEKKDFYDKYFRLVTENEKRYGYPDLPEPIRPFGEIDNSDEFSKFKEHFWHIRDTNPNTPENEFKELVDGRLRNVENEIFAADIDIPQTFFSRNGGLRGDLAHVYLLYGAPNYKDKMSGDTTHVDLMVWYYIDIDNRVLMAFLFYEKYDRFRIFRNQEIAALDIKVVLKEISTSGAFTSDEGYQLIWDELLLKDPEGAFIRAMFSFSDYSHLNKNTKWTIDEALKPPEPASLTAERFKPTILGQPNIPEGTELFESGYRSFLPAYVRINVRSDNLTFLMVVILRKNVDWAKQDNEEKPYAANLNLRISFQNKKTLKLTEFTSYFRFELSQVEFDKRDDKGELFGSSVIFPVALQYFDGENFGPTLGETLKQLEPGEYVVNIYLQHTLTKKDNALREEIVIE